MLEVTHLSKNFHNEGQINQALIDISFKVNSGEFACILGPSGSGKSTLLRCLGGYEKPSEGMVTVKGHGVTDPGLDRVMVFQGFDQLFPWKTVLENITFALKQQGVAQREAVGIAVEYLELVGLKGYQEYYPHQLSGGMKQRAALARSLSLKPDILLMDEPFGSLDAQTRRFLQDELARIWATLKTTIIFVTHDIEESLLLADWIMILTRHPGRIKSIINNPLTRSRNQSMPGFADLRDRLWNEMEIDR